MFSTGKVLAPLGPWIFTVAPDAISAGTLSPAGEALHRFPPNEALPWICSDPISLKASKTPGQDFPKFSSSSNTAPATAAPIKKEPSPLSVICCNSEIFFISIIYIFVS